jgi:DNA-binding Xre family transcriptional regulator
MSRMELVGIGSQVDLARQAGLDYPNLNRILNGAAFSSVTLEKLCRALSCHPGEICQLKP